jgi:hypothetical protein
MKTETITVRVAPQVAIAYRAASEEDRRKFDLLVNLQLTECLRYGDSLEKVIGEMGKEAAEAGLTPEILDSILHEV